MQARVEAEKLEATLLQRHGIFPLLIMKDVQLAAAIAAMSLALELLDRSSAVFPAACTRTLQDNLSLLMEISGHQGVWMMRSCSSKVARTMCAEAKDVIVES